VRIARTATSYFAHNSPGISFAQLKQAAGIMLCAQIDTYAEQPASSVGIFMPIKLVRLAGQTAIDTPSETAYLLTIRNSLNDLKKLWIVKQKVYQVQRQLIFPDG
jgi:hypothetical protein